MLLQKLSSNSLVLELGKLRQGLSRQDGKELGWVQGDEQAARLQKS